MMLQRQFFAIPILILAILAFINNDYISLWDQDEAAYAGFAKTMLETGNWLVPDFIWSDVHRKPPFHFWSIALSYKVFGINEFAVRFPSAVFILLTYWLVFLSAKELFDRQTARIAVIVLGTTLFVPFLAKMSLTDASLLFLTTLCALSMIHIIRGGGLKWSMFFSLGFAMALLTKGPPVIIFSVVMALLLLITHPNRMLLFKPQLWLFGALAFVPVLIWGWMSWQKDNGEFMRWMIDWYILKRVNGSVFGQTGPPGTHLLLIVLFFIPYLWLLPTAAKTFWTTAKQKRWNSSEMLLFIWFIAGWLVYEFSPSKLPSYTVAAHVPLAILVAQALQSILEGELQIRGLVKRIHLILFLAICVALPISSFALALDYSTSITLLIMSILLIVTSVLIFSRSNDQQLAYRLLILNLAFQIALWAVVLPLAEPFKNSTKKVAEYAIHEMPASTPVFIANSHGHPPSLPFYLKRHFNQVSELDKTAEMLSLALGNEPAVLIVNEDQKTLLESGANNLSFEPFSSFRTDRKNKSSYYVLIVGKHR